MAKKSSKMHQIYYEALKALGQKVTKRQRTTTFEKMWKNLRKEYQSKGETPPNLYRTAKEYREHEQEQDLRDENMQTPVATEDLDEQSAQLVIEEYETRIDTIYQNTLAYIADNKDGKGHEGGKLASIADYRRSELDDAYWTLKTQLQELKNSGLPATVIAQAIRDNVELDYDIAISLMPPSDIIIDFEETTQQMFALMQQIELRAQELAEQAEREYYGQ